jgi:hypothetical protein
MEEIPLYIKNNLNDNNHDIKVNFKIKLSPFFVAGIAMYIGSFLFFLFLIELLL